MKTRLFCLATAVMIALSLTACSAAHGNAPAHAAATATPADPECPLVLDGIPANAPATQAKAAAVTRWLSTDQGILGSVHRNTLLWSLATAVSADALRLSFDLGGLGSNTTGDLTKYENDVAVLRRYCRTGA